MWHYTLADIPGEGPMGLFAPWPLCEWHVNILPGFYVQYSPPLSLLPAFLIVRIRHES